MERLSPQRLCRGCDPADLGFTTTDELEDLDEILGQERAVRAVRFATEMPHEGYNLFVLGPVGTGRHHLVQQLLRERAAELPVADDWCYVHCFAEPTRPRALRLPAGRGVELRDDMSRLVDDLRISIPAAFDGDEYRSRRQALEHAFEQRRQQAVASVREEAGRRGVALLSGPTGIGLAPARDGKPIPIEELERLTIEEQTGLQQAIGEVQHQLEAALRQLPRWVSEHQEAIRALDRQTTTRAVEHLVEALRRRWSALPEVIHHLEQVTRDVIEHAHDLFRAEPTPGPALDGTVDRAQRYGVNTLVDRTADAGAPLVYEDNPTLHALVGRVEHHARLGALVTDFTLIRPGAMHRANGGFLVLDAEKVLTKPLAWEHLKRALRSRELRIQSLGEAMNLVSTVSLEPDPIPLDLKVVLVGERNVYYALSALDPEFPLLFKVPADVEDQMERTPEGTIRYARLIATLARRDALLPFEAGAVAQVIVHACRLAGDSQKLSTHMDSLTDLMREANHHARHAGRDRVCAGDVLGAIDEERSRHGRLRERGLEATLRGTLRIETGGETIGQVNGLSVVSLGRASFGRPGRITARVRLGRGQVVDIEREVQLGGPVHSKGVLILTGFLGSRFAADRPLALSASLVFEQSYGPIEGDSASLAETLALLSALAQLPVRQGIAVTGSIDQHGQVQAVGGVNDKIEGFFALCAARGLTGDQGVVLPASNASHLMLHPDVVEAVSAGQFHVWTVTTVDEALTLLMGREAGARGEDGTFPEGTINARVEERLRGLADQATRHEPRRSAEPRA